MRPANPKKVFADAIKVAEDERLDVNEKIANLIWPLVCLSPKLTITSFSGSGNDQQQAKELLERLQALENYKCALNDRIFTLRCLAPQLGIKLCKDGELDKISSSSGPDQSIKKGKKNV